MVDPANIGCRDQNRGAPQPRILTCCHHANLGSRRRRRQRTFCERFPQTFLHQVPGKCDFTADVDKRGIERLITDARPSPR